MNRIEPLPDGIYIGLHEDRYHADSALGSSNVRNLLKGPNRYWQTSWMNPHKPREKLTDSRVFGKGMHKLLLEGDKSFREIYVRRPNDDEDANTADKSALTKAAKKALKPHQFLLKGPEFDFIQDVKAIIDSDPDLEGCLDNALTEVSIFWTRTDGLRLKGRLDALKLRGYGDIKSIANERDWEMGQACRYAIGTWRYDMQVEHYNEARRALPDLFKDEKVFFGMTHANDFKITEAANNAIAFLREVSKQPRFAAQLVFVPKLGNDNALTQTPDAWSCVFSPANPALKVARDDIETALMIYSDAMNKFGTDRRWLPGRAVREIAPEELPYDLSRRAAA